MDSVANYASDELADPLDKEAERVARISQLKNTRAGFKSELTKKRNEVSKLLGKVTDIVCVKKISELNQAFENFKGAHNLYTRSLVELKSNKEAYEYFHCECNAVSCLKERLTCWISEIEHRYVPPLG